MDSITNISSELSIENLPPEILEMIFQCTENVKDFITLGSVSKNFKEFSSHVEYENYILLKPFQIRKMSPQYKFTSIKILSELIAPLKDSDLKSLKALYKDRELTIKRLDISNCTFVTDAGLEYLDECIELNLTGCSLNGSGLSHLKKCQVINLSNNYSIYDKHIKHLSNCTKVILDYCDRLTDACLEYLVNCKYLSVKFCFSITDKALKALRYRMTVIPLPLSLVHCNQITDASLKYITGGKKINLNVYRKFNEIRQKYLSESTKLESNTKL